MLGQKKLREAKEEIDRIVEDFAKVTKSIKEVKKVVSDQNVALKEQRIIIKNLHEDQKKIVLENKKELSTLQKTNDDLRRQVQQIKEAEIELKNSVTEKFNQELRKRLDVIEKKFSLDVDYIQRVGKDLKSTVQQINDAKVALTRFNELSKTIKKADFSLQDQIKLVEKNDREKLRLLKKIDELESMIAKMKRSRNNHRR